MSNIVTLDTLNKKENNIKIRKTNNTNKINTIDNINNNYYYCKICNVKKNAKYKSKYDNSCYNCYKILYKNIINQNRRIKEETVANKIKEVYEDFTWTCNKKIENAVSNKRPDLFCDFGSYVMIIEIDEHKHKQNKDVDEKNRLLDLLIDVGLRNIVCIRFNPDCYTKKDGSRVQSCWEKNKETKLLEIKKSKENEWNMRINRLLDEIGYWCNNKSNNKIEIIKLFYY